MSSSYQQIPLGIPVSQNPYPSHPYSQNFPDESDPESSLNNPPQHRYPSYHFYGQQQSDPLSQPCQFYGTPQDYNHQFKIVPIDPERRALDMKISDLDKRLNDGWYFTYKLCLYINITLSGLGLFQFSLGLIFVVPTLDDIKGTTRAIVAVVLLILISWLAGIFQHSLVFKNAMSAKNLEGARRGLKSMIGFAVYFFVTFIGFIGAIEYAKTTFLREEKRDNYVPYYVQAFVYIYAFPTFLKFFGAKKVIDLLEERETLVGEMKARHDINMA